MKTTPRYLLMLMVLAVVGCSGAPATLTDPSLLLPTLEVVATRTLPPQIPTATNTTEPTQSPMPEPTATSIPATSTPAPPTLYHNAFAVGFSADGSRLVFNAGNYDETTFEAGRSRAYLYETASGTVAPVGQTGSTAADFSKDGRTVLLYGRENALEPLANHESFYILVDTETGQEERMDLTELNKELYGSSRAGISPDGQWFALTFFENTGAGYVDIYLQPRGESLRVSQVTRGTGPDFGFRTSYYPTFSPDGGWLVFLSSASNLVEGDKACTDGAPNCHDLFVYEISTERLERIPANFLLAMGTPTFRLAVADGARWIAWADVEEKDGQFRFVIRLHDRQTGATETICGAEEGCSAHTPALSADGRWLAYVMNMDGDPASQVYLLDRHSGGRSMISVDEMGLPGDAQSGTIHMQSEGFNSDLQISGDGRFVAFSSQAANLLPAGAEKRQCLDPVMLGEYTCYDLFVYDREAGSLRLIPVP